MECQINNDFSVRKMLIKQTWLC